MREKYKENIAYLHKRETVEGIPKPSKKGLPFFCNIMEKRGQATPTDLAAGHNIQTSTILKTTTQLNFEEFDYITFDEFPDNNVNAQDFSIIKNIYNPPYRERGNKHRSVKFKEYHLTIG